MFDDSFFNFSIFKLASAKDINSKLYSEYSKLNASDEIKRTHLFNGRYENIYIKESLIPTVAPVLEFAKLCAKEILKTENNLDMGYWFNDMPPGSVTIPHSHDDDDELLSGAYYIKVPESSGDLVLSNNGDNKTITPIEGQLILFKPDCVHEVTINNCDSHRLSIGINFGIKTT